MIELLVVIAIIALLIGILLPALGHARRTAWSAISQSNLRSHTQTLALYAGDHKDEFLNPFQAAPYAPTDRTWILIGHPILRDGDGNQVYLAQFNSPGQWYSEMYGMHWYAYAGSYLADGDTGSEVQFAPADYGPHERWEEAVSAGDGSELLADTSYIYSPTCWFRPDRYEDGPRAVPARVNGFQFRTYVARNKITQVRFPASKVMIWERFDFMQQSRDEFTVADDLTLTHVGSAKKPPLWANPRAKPYAATTDGSVTRADMSENYELARQGNLEAPTDPWNPSLNILRSYRMEEDGLENGGETDPGLYPAWFWATRDGIWGRDLQR